MTESPRRPRIAVVWAPETRADLHATALEILHCVDRYLANRTGEVKKLKPPLTGFRLRCGDYRIFFDLKNSTAIDITAVRHRKDAYR
jgi:mRNA-degrading endonuclease RelE of RelBE toxin-antitoxin system